MKRIRNVLSLLLALTLALGLCACGGRNTEEPVSGSSALASSVRKAAEQSVPEDVTTDYAGQYSFFCSLIDAAYMAESFEYDGEIRDIGSQYVDMPEMIGETVTLEEDGTGYLYWGDDNQGPIDWWTMDGDVLRFQAGVAVIEGTVADGLMTLEIDDGFAVCFTAPGGDVPDVELISMEDYITLLYGLNEETETAEAPAEPMDADAAEPPALSPLMEEALGYYYGWADGGYDREAALAAFREAADSGEADAWYYIGQLSEQSAEADRFETAMECYDRSIELGSALGLIGKGRLYEFGRGVEADYEQARSLFQEAVDRGCTEGNFGLGMLYFRGEGIEADGVRALEYFELAREGTEFGLVNYALLNIGNMYRDGAPGVEQDHAKAVEIFRQGAEAGYGYAMNNLGVMYKRGTGVEQDVDEAHRWFERAGALGDGTPYWNMAQNYWYGDGVEQDQGKALSYFELAAEYGEASAQAMLGDLYYNGNGVPQNYETSLRWYLSAAADNEPSALRGIGKQYYYGDGVEKDKAQAVDWFLEAAEYGDAEAMDYLGYMYFYGQGVEEDYAQSLTWLIQAYQAAEGNDSYREIIREDLSLLVDAGFTSWDDVDSLIETSENG